MDTLTLDLPAMYGDHHVLEVRRILLEIPGVEDVYASSGFQAVEVQYDPAKLNADDIKSKLDEAGYLGELMVPEETGIPATEPGGEATHFRHTAAFEQTGNVVSFGQSIPYSGRPLWPCPGMGVIKSLEEA